MDVKSTIRTVLNYPVEGVRFRDITTLLQNPQAARYCINQLHQRYEGTNVEGVAVVEARGFVFGSVLAYLLNLPLIPIRKQGKLPGKTVSTQYALEYGKSGLEIHVDAIASEQKILVVDDVVATGGTLSASVELVANLGGQVHECVAIIELIDLGGREKLAPIPLHSLVTFREDEKGKYQTRNH